MIISELEYLLLNILVVHLKNIIEAVSIFLSPHISLFRVFLRILLIEDFEHLEIKDLHIFFTVCKPSQMSENFRAFSIAVPYFVFLFIDNRLFQIAQDRAYLILENVLLSPGLRHFP